MNNRHRSVLVRVPVGRGPLSTVKHICFASICLLNLAARPGGSNGRATFVRRRGTLCTSPSPLCGAFACHLRHSAALLLGRATFATKLNGLITTTITITITVTVTITITITI